MEKYKEYQNIRFMGYISPQKIDQALAQNDCLIIPSFNEGGPLVGIEGMAAGRLILSTKVGAMEERLIGTNNDFWFDINNYDSFKTAMDNLLGKSLEERLLIASNVRNKYLEYYSAQKISTNYIEAVERFI